VSRWKPPAGSASSNNALLPCLGILLSRRVVSRLPPVVRIRPPDLPDADTLFFFVFAELAREEPLLLWRG
jgi:hypothetical protein